MTSWSDDALTACYRRGGCRRCPRKDRCTDAAKRVHVLWSSKQAMVRGETIRKAARILATGWFTAYALGCRLYATEPKTALARKSVSVRARRSINRLLALGLLAVRPATGRMTGAQFTLIPGGLEEIAC